MQGRIITAMGNKFHPQCFVCTYCRKVNSIILLIFDYDCADFICIFTFLKPDYARYRSSKTASTRQIRATSSLTALTALKNCSDITAMLTTANSTQLATNKKKLLTKCPPEKTNPPINGLLMCRPTFSPFLVSNP